MKRRMFLMAAMVLVALTAMGQMTRVAAQEKQAVDLENVRGLEPIRMQPDTVMPNGEWQRVVQSEMTAKESYKYVKQVLARIVPDYQRNVQLEDTADSKIIVTATLPLLATVKTERVNFLYRGTYDVTLTVLMKDQRYRVSCENVICSYEVRTNGQTVDRKTKYTFEDAARMTDGNMQFDMRSKAGKLVYLIDSRLKKQKSDDDF